MKEPEIMLLKEACAFLKIHHSTARRLIKKGMFPAWRLGSDYRVSRSQLLAWMAEQPQGQVTPRKQRQKPLEVTC